MNRLLLFKLIYKVSVSICVICEKDALRSSLLGINNFNLAFQCFCYFQKHEHPFVLKTKYRRNFPN